MTQTATVKTISDRTLILGCDDEETCLGCAASCGPRERLFEASNPRHLQLNPGDRVEVDLPRADALWAGLLIFGLPLLLFAAGYLLAEPISGDASDPLKALFGVCGMAIGFAVALLVGRLRGARSLPRVTSLYSGANLR
ncbi:MAG TPA: SoxR reducing system RseC family protein [Spirochaetia bacterium]|nr:SoxR reducing system RseC family protein [Spirochaetia bacterium]